MLFLTTKGAIIFVDSNLSLSISEFQLHYPISGIRIESEIKIDKWAHLYDTEEKRLLYDYWGRYFDNYINFPQNGWPIPYNEHAEGYYRQGVHKWVQKEIDVVLKKEEEKKKRKEKMEQARFERALSVLFISTVKSLHVLIMIVKVFF